MQQVRTPNGPHIHLSVQSGVRASRKQLHNSMAVPRLLQLALGIYTSFIVWGYLQERTSSTSYVGVDGVSRRWTSVLVQNMTMALVSSMAALGAMRFNGQQPSAAPALKFLSVAFSNTIASPFGYASLKYISFPLLTLAKASKPIPIMLFGTLFGRRYKLMEYTAAICITAGIAMFTMKPSKSTDLADKQGLGLFLVAINLALDGFTNARQEIIFKETRCKNYTMMYMVNLWTAALIAGWLAVTFLFFGEESELAKAFEFAAVSPEIVGHVVLFSLCGAIGQMFIFTSMAEQGAVTTTTICLTRKFFSILISIVMYGHPVRPLQWVGFVVVFGGLGLQAYCKASAKAKIA